MFKIGDKVRITGDIGRIIRCNISSFDANKLSYKTGKIVQIYKSYNGKQFVVSGLPRIPSYSGTTWWFYENCLTLVEEQLTFLY